MSDDKRQAWADGTSVEAVRDPERERQARLVREGREGARAAAAASSWSPYLGALKYHCVVRARSL